MRLSLTQRQAEVLHWIAEGKTNDEIGTILECSVHTAKNHMKDIFDRLGVSSRTAAAACVYRIHVGKVPPPSAQPTPAKARRHKPVTS